MFSSRNLAVSFGDTEAIRDITFDIARGESVALIGRNGAGKSTICGCLLGIIPHLRPARVSGQLLVGGAPTTSVQTTSNGARVGFVLDDPEAQFVSLSVAEEVALTLAAHGREVSQAAIMAILDHFGIGELFGRSPMSLSEGEKRRVTLAALAAAEPEAMVLDDPTAALDAQGKATFCELAGKWRRSGRTVVFSTHEMDVVAQCAQRVLGLERGKLVADRVVSVNEMAAVSEEVFGEAHVAVDAPPNGLARPVERQPVLEAHGIAYSVPGCRREIVTDLDVTLGAGDALVVRGPNGSGKTTLLSLLAGLLCPSRGVAHICGMLPREVPWQRRGEICGFLFQNPDHQILMDQVDEELVSAIPASARTSQATSRRLEWIRAVLTLPAGADDPHLLSRGQRKIVGLATVLAPGPSLLLLDEPELGLDPVERRRVITILELVRQHWGTAVVATTQTEGVEQRLTGAQTLQL